MPNWAYGIVGLILGASGAYGYLRSRYGQNRAAQSINEVIKDAGDQLLRLAKEQLDAKKEEIKTDLTGKKEMIQMMVEEIRKELKTTGENLTRSEKERISSFSALQKELEAYKLLTSELRGSTDDLKRVLSNNQLRGAFGERVAEDLLKMAGFVIGQDYLLQTQAGPGRPDVTLLLPDGTRVQIDVKFPYAALQRFTEAKTEEDRQKYMVQFTRDVREKIKQIASRDYINPSEHTVDFAVAFIPNEMIFSFIYDRMNEVWEEAMSKKVILAGPYSFTAMLRLIKQAHANFRVTSNIGHILSLIQSFRSEFEKFSGGLDVLGARIEATSKQFQEVSSTRSRQLTRVMDKIDSHEALQDDRPKKLGE